MEGDLYVVEPDGSIREGWPVGLPDVLSGDARRGGPPNRDSVVERGAFASPALVDLDDDDALEIVLPAFDGQVHVFRADGSVQPGFPVTIVAPVLWRDSADAQPSMIMTSPAIGDANGDGIPDIAVGSNEYGSDSNTGAIHLIHGDGNLHEGGAAHPNWPVVVTSLNLFPFVGRGTSAAVAMADVNGDGRPDLAVTGNAGTVDVLDGIQPARAPGEDPLRIVRLDSAQRGPLSDLSDPVDRPLLNTFATGSFGDLDQDGVPDFITGGAGLKLAVNLGGGWENEPFAHQVGVWTTRPNDLNGRGNFLPGFPRRIEDYLFFMNPTSADVSGDGYPEVVVGSGGYYVHAWDGCGEEAPGFPKFVGSWVIATPALGDIDGDGLLEVVTATRAGYLFAFDTDGPADGSITWPEWRHDGHNTGNFEAALSNGGQKRGAAEPLECEIPEPMRDAGVPTEEDAGTSDSDAGPPGVSGVAAAAAGPRAKAHRPQGSSSWRRCSCDVVDAEPRRRAETRRNLREPPRFSCRAPCFVGCYAAGVRRFVPFALLLLAAPVHAQDWGLTRDDMRPNAMTPSMTTMTSTMTGMRPGMGGMRPDTSADMGSGDTSATTPAADRNAVAHRALPRRARERSKRGFAYQRIADLFRERDGSLEGWRDELRAEVGRDPNAYAARMLLGHVLVDLGRPGEARESYEAALALRADDPTARVALGALLRSSDPARARELYEGALEHTRDDEARSELLRELGELALDADDYEAAQRFFGRLGGGAAGSVFLKTELARALVARRRFEQAIAEYERVLGTLRGDNRVLPPVLRELAEVQLEAARMDDAIATLDRALRLAGPNRACVMAARRDGGGVPTCGASARARREARARA
ncbi:MAG: FG-GAP-like repeat-containing protein [Polyangiales bacterium]